MNIRNFLILPIFLFAASVFNVYSATLQLTKIGALDLAGKTYTEWWYTATSPVLMGKAAPDSTVTIAVDSTSATATANSSGDWSYSTQLVAGDYNITITQGSESYAFKLHLGQGVPTSTTSQTTQSTTSVPETGMNQTVALSFGIGIALLSTYLYVWGDSSKNATFAKRLLNEE